MLRKRKKNFYGHRQSYLMPTLLLLLLSMLIAFGGAMYWDKLQEENQIEQEAQLQNQQVEEITLPEPEVEEPDLTDSEEDVEKEPSEEKNSEETPKEETPSEEQPSDSKPEEEEPVEDTPPVQEPEEEKPVQQEETPVISSGNTAAVVPVCAEVDASYFSDAAFVGDSLTQGLQLYDILDTHVIANKGINLQTIYNADKIRVPEGYTSVFAELERIQPKKIYIQLGMNDIAWRGEGDFIRLYGELIDKLKAAHPSATLYIQSIFPVTAWYSQEDNGINNNKVVRYNNLLKDLAAEKSCHYLDVHSVLVNSSGALPNEVSPDGIHLNAPYYKTWFNYLKTHVAH